jgi:single-strand DNA-binding protein
MLSLNKVMLIGNLTRDPESRITPSGMQVASFGLATNRRWQTPEGVEQNATEFHEIVAWGKLAEIATQILKKGQPAFVEGRIQTRSWNAPDGSKRYRTEIIAENIIALSKKGEMIAAEDFLEKPSEELAAAPESEETPETKKPKEAKESKEETKEDNSQEEIKLEDLDEVPF